MSSHGQRFTNSLTCFILVCSSMLVLCTRFVPASVGVNFAKYLIILLYFGEWKVGYCWFAY